METLKERLLVRSYDAPAVVYEAALVVRAGVTTESGSSALCICASGDLLDLFPGK